MKMSVPPAEQANYQAEIVGRKREQREVVRIMAELTLRDRKKRERHERRIANGTAAKPRQTCKCAAYPWPHRPGGGNCRYPDPPAEVWKGKAGRHPYGTFARVSGGSSTIRRRIIERYGFHPICDRDRIRRWLPKLYAACSRREGWPW